MRAASLTQIAHERLSKCLKPGDIVIDATLGNGHDAAFLQRSVSPGGCLYGFDLQLEAVERSRQRLSQAEGSCRLCLHHESHENLASHVEPEHWGQIAAVVYNLGYLPGGSKSITTRRESTLKSLDQAVDLLKPAGLLSVMCYRGHPEGARETEAVKIWAARRSRDHKIEWLDVPPGRRLPPRLLLLTREQ